MELLPSWRWFGPPDPVSLSEILQTGTRGIVSALHHIPEGEIWPIDEIKKRRDEIEDAGFVWSVVESVHVHESIKLATAERESYLEKYRVTLKNLAACGITTICYNFMPVLDWTRTDLKYPVKPGMDALHFDMATVAAFDLFRLQRPGAISEYSDEVVIQARENARKMNESDWRELEKTLLAALPGSEGVHTLDSFGESLIRFSSISPAGYRENWLAFIRAIRDVAIEHDIKMAIHPDDPPFSLFGLPRIFSTEADFVWMLDAEPHHFNGITFCTGSLGAREDNAIPEMVARFRDRIHFLHLRNVTRSGRGIFTESGHLTGDVDMVEVCHQLVGVDTDEDTRTVAWRPDHGLRMLDDFNRKSRPGYPLIGRMHGMAEIIGILKGLEAESSQD